MAAEGGFVPRVAVEEYQEAGVRSGGLHGQEGSTMEGKTGQGQSPFSSVRAFSGNPWTPARASMCVYTQRPAGMGVVGPWGLT